GGAQGDDGLRIEETSDGNVIVLMERRKPKAGSLPEPDLWLAKINTTSGSTMWQRILGTGFVESPQDMVLVADTIVAVVGWQDVDEAGVATGYDGFLDRYDARTGATIGSRRLFGASGKEDRAYSVSYDNQTDDYIIACGSIGTSTFFPETKGETDWWIIRMAGDNSAFQQWVSRADGQPGVAQGEELRAWPNPARGSLSLNRTDLDYVELYNLAGMRVQRWEGAGHRQLDLSGLGAGMYLLKAAKGSQSWNQKIVIQ
ncbi:MAG: T9SS type A sorting domain-containing protein, partial [Sphingobacteriia bacterium]